MALICSSKVGTAHCKHTDHGDILLMRLAFTEVSAMVCLPQETYQSFASQSSPEPKAPALERGKERARVQTA